MVARDDEKQTAWKSKGSFLIGLCAFVPLCLNGPLAHCANTTNNTAGISADKVAGDRRNSDDTSTEDELIADKVIPDESTNENLVTTNDAIDSTSLKSATNQSKTLDSEVSITRTILDLDKALFLDLIKLAKFNIHFHLEANAHQKWRSITYPLGRESGTAVSLSGTLIDLRQQATNLNHPGGINRNSIKDGIACNITGSAISGCSSGLELAQNAWMMRKATKHGYSPGDSIAFVQRIIADTDVLLEERQLLSLSETTVPRRRVRQLETALIKRIRQQLLFEFRTWSAHSRDQAWRENTFFAIDSAQNFLRMTASILARKSLDNPDLASGSLVCALISNSAATINPIFRNLVGYTVRKYQIRQLAKEFRIDRPEMPEGMSHDELAELQAKHSVEKQKHELLTSALLLSERSERLDVNLDRETKDVVRYRQVAQQQSVSGPLIGLTGLAGSILSSVAFFGYRDQPRTAIKIGFPGRISNVTGQSYALLNTPYTVFQGMRRSRRLKAKGQLPEQILSERLKHLDKLEAQVRTLQPEF